MQDPAREVRGSFARSVSAVSLAMMLSRVLGFLRDAGMAFVIGTGFIAEAFMVAWRLPTFFRGIFGEGEATAAFVPLFSKEIEGSDLRKAQRFSDEVLSAMTALFVLFVIVVEIAMPAIIRLLAPGFGNDHDKFEFTVLLARIAFPYLLLVSLTALAGAALNSLGRFAAPALSPALFNAIVIAALVYIWETGQLGRSAGIVLAASTLVGGILQLTVLVRSMRLAGLRFRLRLPRYTFNVNRFATLATPAVIAIGLEQFNIVIGTLTATLQAGAVAYLYYAHQVFQLPLRVIGLPITTVGLPALAAHLKAGKEASVARIQNRSIELALLLSLPAAVALGSIAEPIIRVLFERGRFDAVSTSETAAALTAFAFGLPGFMLAKVLSASYFAREDTRTPMIFAGVSLGVNIAGNIVLFPLLGHVGIVLAISSSGAVYAWLLGRTLRRRGAFSPDARLLARAPRIAAAAIAMGIVLAILDRLLDEYTMASASGVSQAAGLGVLIAGGLLSYGLAVLMLGAVRKQEIRRLLRNGRKRQDPATGTAPTRRDTEV